jgi:hypothetical protein
MYSQINSGGGVRPFFVGLAQADYPFLLFEVAVVLNLFVEF